MESISWTSREYFRVVSAALLVASTLYRSNGNRNPSLKSNGQMTNRVFYTWMMSISNLVAFQAKRFALGAWLLLVIACALGFFTLRSESASLRALQRESAASCQNYLELRNAVNDFHAAIDKVLETAQRAREASYKRTHNTSDYVAATSYRKIRSSIHIVKRGCAQKRRGNASK